MRSLLFLLLSSYVFAQESQVDSSYIFQTDPIVVTAERYDTFKFNSTAALTVLKEKDFALLPHNKIIDVLSTAPGIIFMDQDGLGEDPIINMRGFYGGGEAEYMLVLVDGRPLNDFESDLVNWNALPITGIQSIEILKGQNSSLYGNIALGGVLNIRTKQAEDHNILLNFWGGSYDKYQAELYFSLNDYKIYGSLNKLNSYRDHAKRQNQSLGGSISIIQNDDQFLQLSLMNYWTSFDIPGPLSVKALAQNRRNSSIYYKFDQSTERKHKMWIDWNWKTTQTTGINLSLAGEYREADKTITLPLSPEFADTKDRVTITKKVETFIQFFVNDIIFPFKNTLTLGIDGSVGKLNSDYYNHFQGGLDDYQSSKAERGDISAKGNGTRKSLALYLHYEIQPVQPLRLTLGGRYDRMSDSYDLLPPSVTSYLSADHEAFSPKLGINYNYVKNSSQKGNIYFNFSRSFKAPTLNQLYDQRSIPIPVPPFNMIISNTLLEPQKGTGGELGFYHSFYSSSTKMLGDLSLAFYSLDMRNEIDFDLQQFKYINIGKSRHQGFEAGFRLQDLRGITPFINYVNQEATSLFGESEGKYLKAVPRQVITGGITIALLKDFAAGITVRSHKNIFLDDQNTILLSDYTVTDLKLNYDLQIKLVSTRVFAEILNVFDKIYSTTGFPDPSGAPNLVYLYPAAERNFRIGFMMEF